MEIRLHTIESMSSFHQLNAMQRHFADDITAYEFDAFLFSI